jgi:hypothetical protein
MRRILSLLAGLCFTVWPANAEQRVVDIYQTYTFQYADYGIRKNNDCDYYIRDALEVSNIQSPFCTIDSVSRFLKAGWKVQYSEDIRYTVRPPTLHRWECRLYGIECIGKRYYLTSD